VSLLSAVPASPYPGSRIARFPTSPFTVGDSPGYLLGYLNLRLLRHPWRFAQCLRIGLPSLRRWRAEALIVHGVHTPFLWFGAMWRRLTGRVFVVVLTDPPGVSLPGESRVLRIARRFDVLLARAALGHVNGVLALTADLSADYAPGRLSLVLEGFATMEAVQRPDDNCDGRPLRLVYAGALSHAYGVGRLVEAVTARSDKVELQVLGRGELDRWVADQATADPRICGPRFVDRDGVRAAYASADLLVQPRPADQDFVRYSFPSKLLEYIGTGVPVLSTRLHGIPADYEDLLYWIEDDSPSGINAAIDAVLAVPEPERRARAARAADYVAQTRSAAAQGRRIGAFLDRLAYARTGVRGRSRLSRARR
jgi:glycosyltransferase involved in cell wall biosynthesis